MIGGLSNQSTSVSQLIGQMRLDQSSHWLDEGQDESRMMGPLVGELDESSAQWSGSSGADGSNLSHTTRACSTLAPAPRKQTGLGWILPLTPSTPPWLRHFGHLKEATLIWRVHQHLRVDQGGAITIEDLGAGELDAQLCSESKFSPPIWERIMERGEECRVNPCRRGCQPEKATAKAPNSLAASHASEAKLKKVGEVRISTPEMRKQDVANMRQRTERLYSRLDEVKLQKEVRSRQEAYAKNREKAKEFHKKTLEKLRAKQSPQ
ncbi:hypothetical protein J4Q44_G00338100 [Coregonus suidteri]|uniref:Uncharacterized protein n=1 Tax=Coregonus suidteri TaxID=861788 RepID=A0AAN8KRM0_9TELE